MLKIFLKKFNLLFYLVFFLLFNFYVYAEEKIVILGNKNISKETISSFFPKNIDFNNENQINNLQKKLFQSGFFKNIKIEKKNDDLIIRVEENSIVNFFYIEGEVKKDLLELVQKKISVKENDIFNLYLIKDDIKIITSFLNSVGYLNNQVTYQLIQLENNKINIFYKIKLNNKFKINRVFFIGDKEFKSSVLADVILSEEDGWWKFLSNFTTVSEDLINNDISRLKNFYLNEGFYDAQIVSSSIKVIDNKKANITYSINSGNKFFFNKITVANNTKSLNKVNTDYLEKIIVNKLNQKSFGLSKIKEILLFFDDYSFEKNLDLIFNYRLNKISSNKLDLNFEITEVQNKKFVNKIIFTGNDITNDSVLRNFFKFSEGDIFYKKKLTTAVEKIEGSGLFSNVKYNIEPLNESSSKINIIVDVQEKPTGEIAAGAGAGSNGAVISGSLKEKNFLGKGLIVDSSLNIGTQKVLGKVSYTNPDFRNSGNALRYSAFIESNKFNDASYENKIIGTNISTRYEIFNQIYFNPGASIDHDSVAVSSTASNSLKRRDGDYLTSKVNYSIEKDTRNKAINPSSGYTVGFGQGLSILFSDIPYINNKIFGSYFNNYRPNFTGSIRYKFESINGFGEDIKFSDRLYVSSNYLRGFDERGIGPKIDNDFVGGNYSYYTTLSTTFPNGLPDKWNATTNLFYDIANVWGVDDSNISDSNKIRSSLGLGFSWVSPLGPISISYAEPITKSSTDDVQQFNFKIGTAF